MDNSDAALLCHGDGEARLGDGVHGGAEQRNIQSDIASDSCLRAHLGRNHFTVGRDKQNVVEGKGFWNWELDHKARAADGKAA